MNKIINGSNKYLLIIEMLVVISIVLSITYSNYFVESSNHRVAEMYIGSLKYSMKIDSNETNTLSLKPGVTVIDVDVNNLNPVDTYYKLLYLNNSNLEIKYFSETKDTDEVKTSYKSPNDSITSSNTNNLKLFIRNNSNTYQDVSFSLKGGYINNTLSDISVPSGYSEITALETPATNTYFCKTTEALTQGAEYVNGQYTYRYKQQGGYTYSSSLAWSNIITDGWGVQLTDKTSTDAATSKLCMYINNKPVASMSYMFYKSQATTLELSNFNTSNVTNMSYMFGESQATTLDLSSFDTSNVTNMDGIFFNSYATTLDLSGFDTSKVNNMNRMFYVSKATTLDLSSFDTSNVTDMGYMFAVSQATSLDLSNFDKSKVIDMSYMFSESQLKTIDLSNFDTNNVTNMKRMFWKSKATTLDLSSFDTSKVTDMGEMFSGSQAITLDLSSFDTSNITDMSKMFENSQATTLDLSSFNTSKVTDMSEMFSGSQATTIDLSSFDTSNVTDMSVMFYESQATTLDLSSFNTSKVTSMNSMFNNSKATTLDLSSFNTSKVTTMNAMFLRSTNLKTIYASNKFNTSSLTDSYSSYRMFTDCTSLVGGSGTKYNSSYTDKTYARIDGGTSRPGYFTDIANKPSTFGTDDWATIVNSVKAGNTNHYKVGDTKIVNLGTYGTHTIRVSNTTTPSECSNTNFSQSACGFVLEFADIITTYVINTTSSNKNGWPASSMRTFVNNDIYNALPADLRNGIINTTTISSHGSSDSANFLSTDKLYLLATAELYENGEDIDTAKNLTRQLDYYKSIGVTINSYSGAIKKSGTTATDWWLRSFYKTNNQHVYSVQRTGRVAHSMANLSIGVSPAFRID